MAKKERRKADYSFHHLAQGVECGIRGPNNVFVGMRPIVELKEFGALKAERLGRFLQSRVEAFREVRVLDVLNKVGDQELPPVPMLRGAQPFRSVRALARVPLREDSTV